MTNFLVLPPAVRAAASTSTTTADELRDELTTLRVRGDELLTEQWSGRAAASFDRAWAHWCDAAAQVVVALEHLGELLGDTVRQYETSEAAIRDYFAPVAS